VGEEAPHRRVELDEPRAQVNFGEKEIGGNDTRDKMWFMDISVGAVDVNFFYFQ
jgi:hypothetical protein